jgi:hypothetical protein
MIPRSSTPKSAMRWQLAVMRYQSADDYWEFHSAVSGPIVTLIGTLDRDEIGAIRATLDPALAPFTSGSGYDIPSLAVGVSGTA